MSDDEEYKDKNFCNCAAVCVYILCVHNVHKTSGSVFILFYLFVACDCSV